MNHEHLCNVIISYCVFSCLLRMYKHRSGISGSCSNSNFCGTAWRSSRVTAPFYIPSNNVWGFQFLRVFPVSFIVLLFDCHPNGCEVESHYDFWFACPQCLIILIKHLFMCLLAFVYIFRDLYSNPILIFKIGLSFFFLIIIEFLEFFICSGCQSCNRYVICRYFLEHVGCLFILSVVSFEAQKFFILMWSNLSGFSFCCLRFWFDC